MAKLSTSSRNKLPAKDFAGKGRSYPIEDKGHAKAAIARAEEFSPPDKAKIIAKAEKKLNGSEGHSNNKEHDKFLHKIT